MTVSAISLTGCPFLQKLAMVFLPCAYTTRSGVMDLPSIRLCLYLIRRYGLPVHTLMTHLCGHIFILHSPPCCRRPRRPRRPRT